MQYTVGSAELVIIMSFNSGNWAHRTEKET